MMKNIPTRLSRFPVLLCGALLVSGCAGNALGNGSLPVDVQPPGTPTDVRAEHHNLAVTALGEDCESVRMALATAWADARAVRAFTDYLRPLAGFDADREARADTLMREAAALYELMEPIDVGIQSVRLARDARALGAAADIPAEVAFWRAELGGGARAVADYAASASAERERLSQALYAQAERRGWRTERVAPRPWEHAERDQGRRLGAAVGVRFAIHPAPGHMAEWWLENLSLDPGYMVSKFRQAGVRFFTPDQQIGAWGFNAAHTGEHDFSRLNAYLRTLRDRDAKLLLELPSLHASRTDEAWAAEKARRLASNAWIWLRYAHPLPADRIGDLDSALVALGDDGAAYARGGVNLFHEPTARAYGAYLKAMADNFRTQDLYDAVFAVHLESSGPDRAGDTLALNRAVDFSPRTRDMWRTFMAERYGDIAELNALTGGALAGFDALELPRGDMPPAIRRDYLAFRRHWVQSYLAIKRKLIEAAFPDRFIIDEAWQFGDHDMISRRFEDVWGGFQRDDIAQFSGVAGDHERRPFLFRSLYPVGFGTRLSDGLESLYRDYLWLHFNNPGNLARYFYTMQTDGYFDHQLGWQGILNFYLTNRLLYQLGPTVANTTPCPQRIGMVLPRATFDAGSETPEIYFDYMGWDWMLQAAKLPYTRVDEHRIRDGALAGMGLDLLILPDARVLDDDVAAAIEEWVLAGGTLLASPLPGAEDALGRPRTRHLPGGLFGVEPGDPVSEAVLDTPLTISIPRGTHSGGWPLNTDRRPPFQTLMPVADDVEVLARYASGAAAITRRAAGRGMAVAMGYPFGRECVLADRCSISFQRTYTEFAREPQLVARTAWVRGFIVGTLGFAPDYEVEYARVARWRQHSREVSAASLSVPKGFSEDPEDYFFVQTVADPRGGAHEKAILHEAPDMALRLFPRWREGMNTRYLGFSTREVHYLAHRATVHIHLAHRQYRVRINNPAIQVVWDVERDVPVGFERDASGICFDLHLPSGHIGMIAYSESPVIEQFGPDPFPGRSPEALVERTRRIGETPPPRDEPVSILYPEQIIDWLAHRAEPVDEVATVDPQTHPGRRRVVGEKERVPISYGEPANRRAAERLRDALVARGIEAEIVQQAAAATRSADLRYVTTPGFTDPVIFIGHVWSNNDWALHAALWPWDYGRVQGIYGPRLPLVPTYTWPGPGRAVVALSRPYELLRQDGQTPWWSFDNNYRIRPVLDDYPAVRRKLFIGGTGVDAERAVDALITHWQERTAQNDDPK